MVLRKRNKFWCYGEGLIMTDWCGSEINDETDSIIIRNLLSSLRTGNSCTFNGIIINTSKFNFNNLWKK